MSINEGQQFGRNPKIENFVQLQAREEENSRRELAERKRTNPQWTQTEKMMGWFSDDPVGLGLDPRLKDKYLEIYAEFFGAYIEQFEPQVRNAVVGMNEKGYPTFYSGLLYLKDNLQVIEGDFRLDQGTKNKLQDLGVNTHEFEDRYRNECTTLEFASTLDVDEMKQKWDTVANLLPETGKGMHRSKHIEENERYLIRAFNLAWGEVVDQEDTDGPNQKFETVQVATSEIINRLMGESVFSNLKDGFVLDHSPGKLLIDTTSAEVLAFRQEIKDINSASPSTPKLLVEIARATLSRRLHPATEDDLLEIAAGRETVPLSDYIKKGKGDCVQIAALAQLAFQELGIASYIVAGEVIKDADGNHIPHIFNLAKLGDIKLIDFPQPIVLSPGKGRVYVIPADKVDLQPTLTEDELEDSSDNTQFYQYTIVDVDPSNSTNRTYFLHPYFKAFPHFRDK